MLTSDLNIDALVATLAAIGLKPVQIDAALDAAALADPGEEYEDDCEEYEDPDGNMVDGVGFQDPGGNSALRRSTLGNPRCFPCPTCGQANALTRIDVARGYQCDDCADAIERGGW